jgi:transposase
MMDTYAQAVTAKRQYRSADVKLEIVREALAEGASVARVARAHGVNANLVFSGCRLYRAGRLGGGGAQLLPVRVTPESATALPGPLQKPPSFLSCSGTIQIRLERAKVRIEGSADPVLLRVLLECLQR